MNLEQQREALAEIGERLDEVMKYMPGGPVRVLLLKICGLIADAGHELEVQQIRKERAQCLRPFSI